METPLTPIEFARRARKLYGDREAVVDGNLHLTYEQFFDRCDRWSATLQDMGVAQGDRVAYIAPNTLAQLESFYAVPQIGAVLVPINYRLTPDDFVYLINHSGAKVVCVHSDYLQAIESVRSQLPNVEFFVVLNDSREGWLDYECLLGRGLAKFSRPAIQENDLLTINYTSGTTSRPKGVMITHRNAWMNTIGTSHVLVNEGANRIHPGVAMRNHYALRTRGGAAGVIDCEQVGLVNFRTREFSRACVDHSLIVEPTICFSCESDEVFNFGKLFANTIDRCKIITVRANHARTAMIDQVNEVVGREAIV